MRTILLFVFLFCLVSGIQAQTDSLKAVPPDTSVAAQAPTEAKAPSEPKKDKSGRKDEFILYAGVSFNQLSVSSDLYESSMETGFLLGGAYKRGKFFYWQAGLRYNNAVYGLDLPGGTADSADIVFSVSDIDIPLNVGINILSATDRILALRGFVGVIPAFTLGVGENDLGIEKDDINSFNLYGQAGIGINIAFLVIETGYNFGFSDLMENDIKSVPGQVFVNLGFRF